MESEINPDNCNEGDQLRVSQRSSATPSLSSNQGLIIQNIDGTLQHGKNFHLY
jgi:hypothetical protein